MSSNMAHDRMTRPLSPEATPEPPTRSSSTDHLPQLRGSFHSDGTVHFEADNAHITPSLQTGPRSLQTALKAAELSRSQSNNSISSVASESSEDYDSIRPDPRTLVVGQGGGGLLGNEVQTPRVGSNKTFEEANTSAQQPTLRLQKIPVTLNETKKKGQYVLTADDDALRKILRRSVEREKNPEKNKRRSKFGDHFFTRRFTAFDRNNEDSAQSPFHGFFILFWLATGIFMFRLGLDNYLTFGNPLGTNEIMKLMFKRDLIVLGLSDGAMCAATGFGLLLQKLILAEKITWDKQGWIIQVVWDFLFLVAVVTWTLFREWPWTHTVFFVLHGLVMLMKQHSYAFYNGHLSEQYATRRTLERKLKQLDKIAPASNPSDAIPKVSSLSTSYLDGQPTASNITQRRASSSDGNSNILRVAQAIESGEPLDLAQIQTFERIIKWEISALSEELKGKSTTSAKFYPNNLTVTNHYEYICLPTVVYELEYPRSDKIDWYYVAEKSIAILGICFIMNLVAQAFIYPVVIRTSLMKETNTSLRGRLEAFPSIYGDLVFPFMVEYLMTWYVIWECILNLLAELTFFADRAFYADWWNSISWDQFARDWNRPVHLFLLRHVYHSSISTFRVSKTSATLITFGLSALVHELVMWCIFKKLRGYLMLMQMMQLPLVSLSRVRWLKGRKTLGNLMFWMGICSGPSLLCSLYLVI